MRSALAEPRGSAGRSVPLHMPRLDPLLLLATFGLIGASLFSIYAATHSDFVGDPYFYVYRQVAYYAVGLILMFLISAVDYDRLRQFKWPIYGFMIGSILFVLAIGTAARGSRRWIELPFINFQPSELGKVLLVIVLAAVVVDRGRRMTERETTARVVLLAMIPAMLVIVQPDLGTGLVYIAICFTVLFIAGISWRYLAALGALGAAAIVLVLVVAPTVGVEVLKPYQVDRLTAFANPSENPAEEGYQQTQSRIAIGAGRKTGRGLERATQTKLNFLPEHHTDFIFAVVGESFGFLGAACVLSLFALLLWRTLRILVLARNLFGALLAGGIAAILMFQIFVNVGMNLGIMPITGVPLPLMSAGGSSALVTFICLGLLQSIYAHSRNVADRKVAA